jgi:transcriptional regulator with XRE-family HTH domain
MEYREIGERIKGRRKELDISASDLADRLSLSKATVHRYENGDIRNIKLPVIESIARELLVNPLWLIGKTREKAPSGGSEADARYINVESILDDAISHIRVAEGLLFGGSPLSCEDRNIIVSSLEVIRRLLELKNR